MIGRLDPTTSTKDLDLTMQAWSSRAQPEGFLGSDVLVSDDGKQVVIATRFASRESYWALADTPDQDDWYRTSLAPLLDGEPRWIDGAWTD